MIDFLLIFISVVGIVFTAIGIISVLVLYVEMIRDSFRGVLITLILACLIISIIIKFTTTAQAYTYTNADVKWSSDVESGTVSVMYAPVIRWTVPDRWNDAFDLVYIESDDNPRAIRNEYVPESVSDQPDWYEGWQPRHKDTIEIKHKKSHVVSRRAR